MNRRDRRRLRRGRGRPKGSTIPLARDKQNAQVALWWAFRTLGYGPTDSARLALVISSNEPLKQEDVDHMLRRSSTEIEYTASSLDEHVDTLARKAAQRSPDRDPWLAASSAAIRGLILAARTGNLVAAAWMLDLLTDLGWKDFGVGLWARIQAASRGNIAPYEGDLGRRGQRLLDKFMTSKKG